MARLYVLHPDHTITPQPDVQAWANWFGKAKRTVGTYEGIYYRVLTVFIGVDDEYNEPPLLFETVIFTRDPTRVAKRLRWSNWQDASQGHARAVATVQTGRLE